MSPPPIVLIVSGGGVSVADETVAGALDALHQRYPIGRLITIRDVRHHSSPTPSEPSAAGPAEAWGRRRAVPVSHWARERRHFADPRLGGEWRFALYWRLVTQSGAHAVLHFPGIEHEVPTLAAKARLRVWRVDPKTRALRPGP